MTKSALRLIILGASVVGATCMAQERGPGGQIYGELLPFVGLKGAHFEIHGLGGGIYNTPGPQTADPEKEFTGFTRAEKEAIVIAIKTDAADAFQKAKIPLLGPGGSDEEPRLVASVDWSKTGPDKLALRVTVELVEGARLIRQPEKIVRATTWQVAFRGVTSEKQFGSSVRSAVRGYVNEFIGLYKRAHANAR